MPNPDGRIASIEQRVAPDLAMDSALIERKDSAPSRHFDHHCLVGRASEGHAVDLVERPRVALADSLDYRPKRKGRCPVSSISHGETLSFFDCHGAYFWLSGKRSNSFSDISYDVSE
jgi:hypothetical protein